MDEKNLAVKEPEGGFTQEDVLEYLRLLDRRIFIIMHSGISWKPEYAQELEEIDKRIAELRVRLDGNKNLKLTICHAVAEGANTESLPCAGDDLPSEDDSHCVGCEYAETVVSNVYCGSCQYHLEHQDCDPDCDLDRQQLKAEVRQAHLNGGRTPYLYNIDGDEYYTTRDGVRHYTRVEG